MGVAVWDRSESARLGDPDTDRLDAPAGEAEVEVESDAHGADNSVSSRGTVRAVVSCGDGDEEAEVTEETDGLRSDHDPSSAQEHKNKPHSRKLQLHA